MTIWRMRIESWITKTTHTHTHTQYVILIASALQQWSQERASMLRYTRTYTACLVSFARDHTCNYVPTPWSRALLKKPTGSQLAKKFAAFYGTRRFITTFTSARHLSLSWASSIHTCNSNFNGMCSSGLRMTSLLVETCSHHLYNIISCVDGINTLFCYKWQIFLGDSLVIDYHQWSNWCVC